MRPDFCSNSLGVQLDDRCERLRVAGRCIDAPGAPRQQAFDVGATDAAIGARHKGYSVVDLHECLLQ